MTGKLKHIMIVAILAVYLLLPLVGTFLYSIAGEWHSTILPESWTFSWYVSLFQDTRYMEALLRTIFVIASSVLLSLGVMLLAMFIVIIYFPSKEKYLKLISMIPYGVPGIVSAIGLLSIYSSSGIPITGTPWIIIGSYAVIIMPFAYQGIKNSLYTINATELIQAAELLGATKSKAVFSVVLPNMMKGVLTAALLSIAMLFGEFALANILVGGQYETLQIYLYQQLSKNGHLTSAIVISYYVIIMLITGLLIQFQEPKRNKKRSIFKFKKTVIKPKPLQNKGIEGEMQ